MKVFAIFVFISCSILLPEAAADCNACTNTWNNSPDCGAIKAYMTCLIDTYETNREMAGCDAVNTKMDTAKTAYDTNCVATPATDSCLCEVAYYQSSLDCTAIKTKLTCLFTATDVGCNPVKTNIELVTEAKVIGKVIENCITDTCECEAIYEGTDISVTTDKCTAIKEKLTCFFTATDAGCDGTTNIALVTAAKDVGKLISGCISNTCECEAIYHGTDTSTDALNCKAATEAETCLEKITSTDDRTCSGITNTTTYLSASIQPTIAHTCSGAGGLLGVPVTVGFLVLLFKLSLY